MAEYKDLVAELRLFETICRNCEKPNAADLARRAAVAIDELEKDLEKSNDYEAFWQQEAEEALRKFQVAIANKPQWFPVTVLLPDNIDEEVLVCNEGYGKDGTGFATVAVYNGNGWLECWERKQYLSCITHWMPLPEPPKEET